MGRAFTDTSEFFTIDRDDELVVAGRRYRVLGNVYERGCGCDDPKFWVKRVEDVKSGAQKIIKLAFFESFTTTLAGIKIECFRDPDKEARVLELVRGHPHFMQGVSTHDERGNNIRILDIVEGDALFFLIDGPPSAYADYFHNTMPAMVRELLPAFRAIQLLHDHGLRHGDIRSDHLFVERATGRFVWIDFDYDFRTSERPFTLDIFGLGSILLLVLGMGYHDYHTIKRRPDLYGSLVDRLTADDFSLLERHRLANLKKLFPQIPARLNDVLRHFSQGTNVFYDTVSEIVDDLEQCAGDLPGASDGCLEA